MRKVRPQHLVIVVLLALVITVVASRSGSDCGGDCGGICTLTTEAPGQILEDVTAKEAYILVQNNADNDDYVILDIRTPVEFESEHIDNAINIDFYSDTFRDNLDELDKTDTYLIYCRTANRTGQALQIMKELGFEEVYNLSGGINDWKAEGFPTVVSR